MNSTSEQHSLSNFQSLESFVQVLHLQSLNCNFNCKTSCKCKQHGIQHQFNQLHYSNILSGPSWSLKVGGLMPSQDVPAPQPSSMTFVAILESRLDQTVQHNVRAKERIELAFSFPTTWVTSGENQYGRTRTASWLAGKCSNSFKETSFGVKSNKIGSSHGRTSKWMIVVHRQKHGNRMKPMIFTSQSPSVLFSWLYPSCILRSGCTSQSQRDDRCHQGPWTKQWAWGFSMVLL